MEQELISVIVPIYNTELYLKRCLDSIIKQTYKNLEIILVDDGSTDNSLKICNEYKAKDKRIKVYHKKNEGLSSTRNYGMKKACGNYLFFIDSDDFMSLDIIEFLYNSLKENQADIVTCKHHDVLNNQIIEEISINNSYLCNNEQALAKLLYQKDCSTNTWAKLYKKELFNNILFPEKIICEDLATTYLLFSKANKVVINTSKKYYYVKRYNSIINSKFDISRMIGLKIVEEETKFIQKNFPNIIKAAINREFMEGIYILLHLPFYGYQKEYLKVKQVIIKNRKIVLFDKESLLKHRVYAFFSYFGLKNLVRIHKLFYYLKTRGHYE